MFKSINGMWTYSYKFNCNVLIVQQICPFEYNTKRSLSDLLADTVVHTDNVRG